MQEMHMARKLLTARQVQEMLDIDASTVYRMAGDGRLPAVKVGRQWRFPAEELQRFLGSSPARPEQHLPIELAQSVLELAANSLGVMMVMTDMDGHPQTDVANPCPRFERHADDTGFIAECAEEWRDLAYDLDFRPKFMEGRHEFECARSFIRSGTELVGMVLAGGVAPEGRPTDDLFDLTPDHKQRVLEALPRVASLLSRIDRACGNIQQRSA
ncbi:MAG: helix-turn-helix domain-containing protein [Acidimicrobiia bacterium]|nr:helix-turn-helix domain-containing protein [Acidimicrobiia bacterium]